MKKLTLIAALAFSSLFVSCDMNDEQAGRFDSANPQSGWVQFENSNPISLIYGTDGTIEIPVELHAPVNKNGIEITYSITDVTGSSTAILPERTGTTEIFKNAQGEVVTEGTLMIPINATAGLTETVEFDVTLTGTSNPNVQVGLGENEKPTTVRVKICPFNVNTTYAGEATSSTGFEGPAYTVTLVPVEGEENTFTTNSAWGTLFVPTLAGNPAAIRDYPAKVVINDDFTVTVTGNDPAFPARYPGGEGTYDPCTDTFDLVLRQGVFANAFTVNVIWSPAE